MITFETGTTMLPSIPGITFLFTPPSQTSPWFDGAAEFDHFFFGNFGQQNWQNQVSGTFSDLGIDFASPVQGIGGWVGKVPNFLNEYPTQVVVDLYNSSLVSLGTATITLNPTVNVPVFFGFTADQPIARFTISGNIPGNPSGFFGVDNFTYGPVIPEPSSLVMGTTGLLTILAARRISRRGRSSARCV